MGFIDKVVPLEDVVQEKKEIKEELERRNHVAPYTRKENLEPTDTVGKCQRASD